MVRRGFRPASHHAAWGSAPNDLPLALRYTRKRAPTWGRRAGHSPSTIVETLPRTRRQDQTARTRSMDLLDRLRPRWRRSDPEVRVAAVREVGARDPARLETIARSDPDGRGRRVAIKKLDGAERLRRLATGETGQGLGSFS